MVLHCYYEKIYESKKRHDAEGILHKLDYVRSIVVNCYGVGLWESNERVWYSNEGCYSRFNASGPSKGTPRRHPRSFFNDYMIIFLPEGFC